MNDYRIRLKKTCCGIVEGFHSDELVESIVARRPTERGEWFLAGQPPAVGQKLKVQVITESAWGVLTGRIAKVGDGIVEATVERTTDDDSIPGGPYSITLEYDDTRNFPWVLSSVELSARQSDRRNWNTAIPDELQTPIHLSLVNGLLDIIPDDWHSIVLDVECGCGEDGMEAYPMTISDLEGKPYLSVPPSELYVSVSRLADLFRSHGQAWRSVRYNVVWLEDAEEWRYVTEFEY